MKLKIRVTHIFHSFIFFLNILLMRALSSILLLKSSLSSTIYITRGKEIKLHYEKKEREKSKRRHVLDYKVLYGRRGPRGRNFCRFV